MNGDDRRFKGEWEREGGNSGLTPTARQEPPTACQEPSTARQELPTARQELLAASSIDRGKLDRFWLLTWTTYGTWLPGEDRGFVSNVDRGDGKGYRRNQPGTEPASKLRGLNLMAIEKMKGPPVHLDDEQANALFNQLQETAHYRGWQLQAIAIMRNHVHVVVGVPGDPEPDTLFRDFKSYGSRALNNQWPKPQSGTWWTESGSGRKLPNDQAVAAAVAYVRDQEFPLFIWIAPLWQAELGPRRDRASGGRKSPVSKNGT